MRLTVEHIRRAPQFTNALLQREIDLRGLCISILDANTLLQLQDDFDVLNLCNNALTTLDSFPTSSASGGSSSAASPSPVMKRVSTLIVHRNKIQRVHVESCVLALPEVRYFAADKNNFTAAKDLVFLKYWKKLEVLSLQNNPVWRSNPEDLTPEEIRAFLIYLCPRLRLLDSERVTQKDREAVVPLRSKFAQIVEQCSSSRLAAAAGGKKTRKRGRGKDTTLADDAGNNPPTTVAAGSTVSPMGGVDATTVRGEKSSDSVEDKLAWLAERLNAPDLTPEELVEIEREMAGLSGE